MSRELIMPFSDAFYVEWGIWKEYKKEQFDFTYKGVYSEQAALTELVNLSGGDEEVAKKIILQSLANGWKGFWAIRKPTSPNGKSKQPSSKNGANSSSLEDDAANVLNKRNAERGQQGYGSNLKAV